MDEEKFRAVSLENFHKLSNLVNQYNQYDQEERYKQLLNTPTIWNQIPENPGFIQIENLELGDKSESASDPSSKNNSKNIIRAIAELQPEEKLETHQSIFEKAARIVKNVKNEVTNYDVKKKICGLLNEDVTDVVTLLQIVTELAKSSLMMIPFDLGGSLLISAACLIVIKKGAAFFCA